MFHGIEDADNLPERLEALRTYAAGHAGVAADGLPDGWLGYAVPSSDTNMARWSVHPAWFVLQAVYCTDVTQVIDTTTGEGSSVPASSIGSLIRERIRQVNVEQLVRQISGCTSTLSAWLGGKQDNVPPESIEQVPMLKQTHNYHFVLHWLHEQMPRYVMAALVVRVNPDHPELLWKKYGAKFADDVQNKRVL